MPAWRRLAPIVNEPRQAVPESFRISRDNEQGVRLTSPTRATNANIFAALSELSPMLREYVSAEHSTDQGGSRPGIMGRIGPQPVGF